MQGKVAWHMEPEHQRLRAVLDQQAWFEHSLCVLTCWCEIVFWDVKMLSRYSKILALDLGCDRSNVDTEICFVAWIIGRKEGSVRPADSLGSAWCTADHNLLLTCPEGQLPVPGVAFL